MKKLILSFVLFGFLAFSHAQQSKTKPTEPTVPEQKEEISAANIVFNPDLNVITKHTTYSCHTPWSAT